MEKIGIENAWVIYNSIEKYTVAKEQEGQIKCGFIRVKVEMDIENPFQQESGGQTLEMKNNGPK